MFEETLARLRTHHKNVHRYRQLLKTRLTDFEREYISKRLSEEQVAIEALSADVPTDSSKLEDNRQASCSTSAAKVFGRMNLGEISSAMASSESGLNDELS